MTHKRRGPKKLSPSQFIKGLIIRSRLARRVKGRNNKVVFQLLWGRLVAVFVALTILGWVSTAAGAWLFVKYRRDFPEVRFVDILLPHRWEDYRVSRGDYYIATAKKNLEEGDTLNVLHFLRVGVQQSPDNAEGRLILASIYNAIGRPELGIKLLESHAYSHADDQEYLSTLISLLFANHEDESVTRLTGKLLGDDRETTDINLMLALAGATASFNRGDYTRAEEIIADYDLTQSRTGTMLQARINWETGHSDVAIRQMKRVAQSGGALKDEATGFLTEYLWSNGNKEGALQAAMLSFISDPLNHAPRLRLLSIYDLMGNTEKRQEEVETFIELFGTEEPAIQSLVDFAGRSGDTELADRLYELVRSEGMDSENAALAVIEARVVKGDFNGAIRFRQEIEDNIQNWTPVQLGELQPLLTTANVGIGDPENADLLLQSVLTNPNIRPNQMLQFAQRLIQVGDFVRGREVLQHVHTTQPLNQEALGRLIRLDIETGNNQDIVENVNRLLKMRKPPPVVLQEVRRHVSSDAFLFQRGRGQLLSSIETALLNAPAQIQGS